MSDLIPLLQTLAWITLISVILIVGRARWSAILGAIEGRISQGDDMTLRGPLGLTAELKRRSSGVPRLESGDDGNGLAVEGDTTPDVLATVRKNLGVDQRGVHLVHVAAPSEDPDQEYDVFAYLHGWGRERFGMPDDLSDVDRAEFFLGPAFWPGRITVVNDGSHPVGFTTGAHAPALCVCRITFKDGHEVVVSRYLDFESGKIAIAAADSQP